MGELKFYSESDIDTKIVPSFLEKLGYRSNEWTAQYAIKAGRTKVKADFLVSSNLMNPEKGINLVIDSKSPDEVLENYIDQVVSYGRLTKSKLSVLINDQYYVIVDNLSSDIIEKSKIEITPKLLIRDNYFVQGNSVSYSVDKVRQAEKVVKIFSEINAFNSVFEKCQNIIRNRDGETGSDAFDELSKLLFIKIYLEDNNQESKFSVKYLKDNGIDVLKKLIFDEVKKKYEDIFDDTDIINLDDQSVMEIVEILQDYNLKGTDVDVKGRAYEILLGKTFIGSLGQHFTPRNVVNFMVDVLNPVSKLGSGDVPRIIDPACGSGGFLIKCLQDLLKEASDLNFDSLKTNEIKRNSIFGSDKNPRSVQVSKMNMTLHGDGKGGIYKCDGLMGNDALNKNKYDYVITNPPFGIKIKDEEILNSYNLAPDSVPRDGVSAEILFTERCISMLDKDGKLGILIPDGLINNKTTKNVRDFIQENLDIDAIISLPDKTFKSANANAVTSILLGTKREKRDSKYIFMAMAEEIGFERKTKMARSIEQNDLIQIRKYYKSFEENKKKYENFKERVIQLSDRPIVFLIDKSMVESGRIDATYHYARELYDKVISSHCVKLSKYATQVKRTLEEIKDEVEYVEFSSIVPKFGVIARTKTIENENRPNRAKFLIKNGDIIAARMRDSETNIAIVTSSHEDSLATNGFIVLKPKPPMTKECLFYLLYQEYNINQVRWKASGTIMPTVDYSEYLNNWMPKLEIDEIEEITRNIKPALDELSNSINKLGTVLFK